MRISATVSNEGARHDVALETAGARQSLAVGAKSSGPRIARLLRETDAVAEVHNTLRAGVPVALVPWHG